MGTLPFGWHQHAPAHGLAHQTTGELFTWPDGQAGPRVFPALPSGKSTDEALLDGHGDGLGAALGAEFAEDAADVELDRRATDYQALGDLGVAQALDHQRQHFALAGAEIMPARLRLSDSLNQRLCRLGRQRRVSFPSRPNCACQL